MKLIIRAFALLHITLLFIGSVVHALPIPTPPFPVPFNIFWNTDKQPGDLIQCVKTLALSSEHEVGDQVLVVG